MILIKEYEAIKREILLQIPGIRYPVSVISSTVGIDAPLDKLGARNDGEESQKELTERQKRILDMLNENEKAQVSDIIKVLPNITKRTIRRDLDGLLEMGKVVRVGEWNQIFYQASKNIDRTVILS